MTRAKPDRKVSTKGARRSVKIEDDDANTMPDVFDLVEREDADAIVEGVARGSVRAVRWEAL